MSAPTFHASTARAVAAPLAPPQARHVTVVLQKARFTIYALITVMGGLL